MRTRKCLPYLILTTLLLGAAILIDAAAVGQIKGRITDAETGQPVVGAAVLVKGTSLGAMTDFAGWYTIRQVPPGTYTLVITHLDYNKVEVIDVEVTADLTIEQDQELTRTVAELDETISVTGERDVSEKFEVSNQLSIPRGVAAPSMKCVMEPAWPPAHGGTAIVNGEPFDAMFYENYGTNPFVDTEDDHLSTFAIDVDDASFVHTRSYLDRGHLPDKDAVRVEEFVNHFRYAYPQPQKRAFDMNFEGADSPFGNNCYLLKIGIQGEQIRPEDRPAANLVFVIDVSGSMAREDRLGLVKRGLKMMVDNLRPDDRVGIAVYGSTGRRLLDLTPVSERQEIVRIIDGLQSDGATNAEEGIRIGYQMADFHFDKRRINRVILCSDGVANVGTTGPDDILMQIERYADRGITLTSVGFGMGNYNDELMEKLGDKGNGQYAYIDDEREARRFFVENLTGVLAVIARDVKIQIDWDPAVVRSYRLLGYENRDVADDKFRDDQEDGGEIGAGHQVTALYEIKLHQGSPKKEANFGTMYVRYKVVDQSEVIEVKRDIHRRMLRDNWRQTTDDFRLAAAAAEFAEILRHSYWARESNLNDVLAMIETIEHEGNSEQVYELERLVRRAAELDDELANR